MISQTVSDVRQANMDDLPGEGRFAYWMVFEPGRWWLDVWLVLEPPPGEIFVSQRMPRGNVLRGFWDT